MNKLENIKIVFIDIDGTLVNKRKRVTLKTRKSIKRIVDKGIYVVISSGRDIHHTIDKSRRALASPIIISSNGSEIYDYSKQETIFIDKIEEDKIKKAWNYCNKNEIGLIIKSISGKYINKYLIGKDKESGILITNFKELKKIVFSQIVFVSNDIEKILKAKKYIQSLGLSVTNYSESFLDNSISDRYRLDINNKNVSKGEAVTKLLKYLNIKKEESLCFGDFINDIDMFKACGVKVAMENACDSLKEKADYITSSNNNNGVAVFLNEYL